MTKIVWDHISRIYFNYRWNVMENKQIAFVAIGAMALFSIAK